MKTILDGVGINYEIEGMENAPVVMLSHSLGTHLGMWKFQMPDLVPLYRVLRFDTRGHGKSDAPQGAYTLEQLAQDAIGLLDSLDINRVHWVGISMGGMIGQAVALNHPDRLKSLTLCDTTATTSVKARSVWRERIKTVRSEGMTALLTETLERWFTPAYLEQNHQMLKQIRQQILNTSRAGFIGCSEAISRLNYMDKLENIRTTTLVVVGEDDPGTPVSASQAICERIDGSQLKVLPAARHLSNIEQAPIFNRTLMAFLKQN